MSSLSVSALYVYPVKSCRGISVPRAEIVRRGFARDRRWMVVDASGRFVTQRDTPDLCLVGTKLLDGGIELSHPRMPSFVLPNALEEGPELDVSVWSHRGLAVKSEDGSAWLSSALKRPVALVYMPERHERQVNPERARRGDLVSFADGYPFLLISEASLDDLNARLSEPLEMPRFRPNIVVRGATPFAEDDWAELRIGNIGFRGVKGCDRCVVTTLDPETGVAGKEPLRTLSTFRKRDGKVWFGMNLVHDGAGWLEVGAEVEVRRTATSTPPQHTPA
ncbi:MAG TPA: MOSC N-terminal beta barrel domain-containing protein [Polyangiaceae bacterium]|nr:MOSC N-terminal beta barrel domain-containing protein [Polyangiaceae bacterium]